VTQSGVFVVSSSLAEPDISRSANLTKEIKENWGYCAHNRVYLEAKGLALKSFSSFITISISFIT